MNKIIGVFIGFLSLYILGSNVYAQQAAWNFEELHYNRCIRESLRSVNALCPPYGPAHTSEHWEHRVQIGLETKRFSPNSFVYIVECLEVGEDLNNDGSADAVCTSGNTEIDKEIFCGQANSPGAAGCDRLSFLQAKPDVAYSLDKAADYGVFSVTDTGVRKITPAKIRTDATGIAEFKAVEWQSYSKLDAKRFYMAIYPYIPPSPTPTPTIGHAKGLGGMQQDIINTYPTSTPTPTPVPVRTAWDPRGRVFDAQTLEPIGQGNVVLKQKNEMQLFDAGYASTRNPLIFNPFILENSGEYIFYVENGEYTLSPQVAGYRHISTAEVGNLHPNAQKIYKSQLYLNDSPAVEEKGSIEYRDIPLMPVGTSMTTEVRVYGERQTVDEKGNMVYSGTISHPYAQLTLQVCRLVEGKEECIGKNVYDYNNGGPDFAGAFSLVLDQKILMPGDYFVRSFEKVDLRALPLSLRIREYFYAPIARLLRWNSVLAGEANARRAVIQPIPRYIEGYVDTKKGTSAVSVYAAGYAVPSYETYAQDGFVAISSDHLPKSPYNLVVEESRDVKTTISTSEFLKKNTTYLASKAVNPYKESFETVSPASVDAKNSQPSKLESTAEAMVKPEFTPTNWYMIILIITGIIICVGVIVFFWLRRKKLESENEL